MLLKTRDKAMTTAPQELLHFIVQYGDYYYSFFFFSNNQVCLQILLTTAVSTDSFEQSPSKFKLLLSIVQERLSVLTLLSMEQEVKCKINFDEIIDQLAAPKIGNTMTHLLFQADRLYIVFKFKL